MPEKNAYLIDIYYKSKDNVIIEGIFKTEGKFGGLIACSKHELINGHKLIRENQELIKNKIGNLLNKKKLPNGGRVIPFMEGVKILYENN